MGINDKAQLMTAGAAARSTMRAKVLSTDDEVKSAALAALGMEGGRVVDGGGSASREDSPELEDCLRVNREDSPELGDSPGVNREVSQELEDYPGVDREVSQELEVCAGGTPQISGCPEEPVMEIMTDVMEADPAEPEPPMPPPPQDPTPPHPVHSSAPAPKVEETFGQTDAPALAGGQPAPKVEETFGQYDVPALAGEHIASAMRSYATKIRKTGRHVGIFPFLV